MTSRIQEYIENKNNLCNHCIYSYRTNEGGLKCLKTKQKPNYLFFCENLKVAKNKKAPQNYLRETMLKDKMDLSIFFSIFLNLKSNIGKGFNFVIQFIIVAFLLPLSFFIILAFIGNPTSYSFLVIFAVIFFIILLLIELFSFEENSFRLKIKSDLFLWLMPNSFLSVYVQMPYYYMVLALFVHQNKKKQSQDNLKIIEQNIIKMFSPVFLFYAKSLLKNGLTEELNDKKFIPHLLKLDYLYRYILFDKLSELLVYENLDYSERIEIRDKLSNNFLNIKETDKNVIDKKYIEIEKQRLKEIERLKLEEKKQRERQYYQHRFFTRKSKDYYSVLNSKSSDSIEIIRLRFKKLAIIYHPDKYVNSSADEQKKAEEKFKEISEAYSNIKSKRGL